MSTVRYRKTSAYVEVLHARECALILLYASFPILVELKCALARDGIVEICPHRIHHALIRTTLPHADHGSDPLAVFRVREIPSNAWSMCTPAA